MRMVKLQSTADQCYTDRTQSSNLYQMTLVGMSQSSRWGKRQSLITWSLTSGSLRLESSSSQSTTQSRGHKRTSTTSIKLRQKNRRDISRNLLPTSTDSLRVRRRKRTSFSWCTVRWPTNKCQVVSSTSDLSIIVIWTFFLISSVATHNPDTPEPIILTFIK